jgi:hypothetical protein
MLVSCKAPAPTLHYPAYMMRASPCTLFAVAPTTCSISRSCAAWAMTRSLECHRPRGYTLGFCRQRTSPPGRRAPYYANPKHQPKQRNAHQRKHAARLLPSELTRRAAPRAARHKQPSPNNPFRPPGCWPSPQRDCRAAAQARAPCQRMGSAAVPSLSASARCARTRLDRYMTSMPSCAPRVG